MIRHYTTNITYIIVPPNVANSIITIEEKESEASCNCNCLYDWKYKITNIQPGTYIIKIIEPYVDASWDQLEFTVDLSGPTSGTFSVIRTEYPWGI